MGSFNTTCAVSHASIRDGDKVRLFFLLSNQFSYNFDPQRDSINKGGQCYPWDDFTIIGGVSIPATYVDYGSYDFDEKSIEALYIHDFITTNYVENVSEKGREYNEFHDHMDVKAEDLSWSKIQHMINSGRLFLNGSGYNKDKSNLPFVAVFAVHENVYQVMIGSNEQIENELSNSEIDKAGNHLSIIEKRFFNLQPIANAEEPTMGMKQLAKKLNLNTDNKKIERAALETDKFLISMYCYNLMLRPVRTSGQDGDLESEVNFMRRIASAVENIPEKWDYTLPTNKFSLNWQEVNFSDLQKMIKQCYNHLDDEEYLYFAKMIEGKDKIIIESEDWDKSEYYEYLGDLFSNKVLPLHILNK